MEKNQFGQIIGNIVEGRAPRKKPLFKEIRGNFCILKALDINAHSLQLFNAFQLSGTEIYTYLPFGPFDNYNSFKTWLENASMSKIYYTIIDFNSNLPQGIASFHDIDIEHGVIEVGSVIYSKLLQKTMAGTEAMYLMMNEVFEHLKYRRYQWRCNALNQPSRNAAQRLGFIFEGIFRNQYVFKSRSRDTAWYSILDTEWPALKNRFEKYFSPDNFDINGKQMIRLQDIN